MEQAKNISDGKISIDYQCVNCDQIFVTVKPKVYCSLRCRQDASLIRYRRACQQDGRMNRSDVQEALEIRFAFALSKNGYYDTNARRLTPSLRKKIIERDRGLCCECGEQGSQIDHIKGSSSEMHNLQLLCADCHKSKTKQGFIEVTPEHERFEEMRDRLNSLQSRIKSPTPQRECDDEVKWRARYSAIMSEQRELLKKIEEDFLEVNKNEDAIKKDLIAQDVSELSELRQQREILKSEKQNLLDGVFTPEIKAQIERIDADFAARVDSIDENIRKLEDRIKLDVAQYGVTIKSNYLQAIYTKGRVSWDLKSLEEYAKSHPEILSFRREGNSSVRFLEIKK